MIGKFWKHTYQDGNSGSIGRNVSTCCLIHFYTVEFLTASIPWYKKEKKWRKQCPDSARVQGQSTQGRQSRMMLPICVTETASHSSRFGVHSATWGIDIFNASPPGLPTSFLFVSSVARQYVIKFWKAFPTLDVLSWKLDFASGSLRKQKFHFPQPPILWLAIDSQFN